LLYPLLYFRRRTASWSIEEVRKGDVDDVSHGIIEIVPAEVLDRTVIRRKWCVFHVPLLRLMIEPDRATSAGREATFNCEPWAKSYQGRGHLRMDSTADATAIRSLAELIPCPAGKALEEKKSSMIQAEDFEPMS
jgi:hypothetical protein